MWFSMFQTTRKEREIERERKYLIQGCTESFDKKIEKKFKFSFKKNVSFLLGYQNCRSSMSKFAEKNRVINLGYTELAINF